MLFKIGDCVEWDSRNNGSFDFREGKIVYILSNSDKETPREITDRKFPNHVSRFLGKRIPGNAKTGYLVEVLIGRNRKPRIYLPWPSGLNLLCHPWLCDVTQNKTNSHKD